MIRFSVNFDPENNVTRVKSFPDGVNSILIGREKDCQLRLRHSSVSRRHCLIEATGNGYFVEDQGSTQGTSLNGQHLLPMMTTPLHHGDVLLIGELSVTVAILEEPEVAEQLSDAARDAVADILGKFNQGNGGDSTAYIKILNGEDEGTKFMLVGGDSWIIGRQEDSNFVIHNPNVSRQQAQISFVRGAYYLTDLQSQHGTQVNGVAISEAYRLVHLDRFTMGTVKAIFYDPSQELLSALEYVEQANEISQTKAVDMTLPASGPTRPPVQPDTEEVPPPPPAPEATEEVDVEAIVTDEELGDVGGGSTVNDLEQCAAQAAAQVAAQVVNKVFDDVSSPLDLPPVPSASEPTPLKAQATVSGGGSGRRRRRLSRENPGFSSPGSEDSVSVSHSATQPPVLEPAPPPPVPGSAPSVVLNGHPRPSGEYMTSPPVIQRDHYEDTLWLPIVISVVCFCLAILGLLYLLWG